MRVTITLSRAAISSLRRAAVQSAAETLEQLYADLVSAQLMPYKEGIMQNDDTFVEAGDSGAVLITGSPQARRLYYHPEYDFQKGNNKHAGAYWLDPYIFGDKRDLCAVKFAEILGRRL